MNNVLMKTIVISLVLILTLGMLNGCSKQNAVVTSEIAETVPKATDGFVSVTLEADGKQITMEDAANMSLQQILTRAKITLNEDDILSIDPAQMFGSNITIKVLRLCHVTVTVTAEDPSQNVSHPIILAGATVADAIKAIGLQLADNQTTNYKLKDLLVDNMEIVISTVKEEEETKPTETTVPAETEPTEDTSAEDEEYEDDWSEDDWSDDDWYEDDWSDDDRYEEPTTPPATEPPATEPSRYVVSEDIYYDCDGSGHGVKVITYSDGTQEEVYF